MEPVRKNPGITAVPGLPDDSKASSVATNPMANSPTSRFSDGLDDQYTVTKIAHKQPVFDARNIASNKMSSNRRGKQTGRRILLKRPRTIATETPRISSRS